MTAMHEVTKASSEFPNHDTLPAAPPHTPEQIVVYLAGPFRAPTAWRIEENIRSAEEHMFEIIDRTGVTVLCPHANGRFFHGTFTEAYWLTATLELMKRCDAVFLCLGWERSEGAKAEKAEAEKLGIPCFTNVYGEKGLEAWVDLELERRYKSQRDLESFLWQNTNHLSEADLYGGD